MALRPCTPADLPRVTALLSAVGLPTADIAEPDVRLWLDTGEDDALRGCVGLEIHGRCALLRSLAVPPEHRRGGVGAALLAAAEHEAARLGAANIYLLTTGDGALFRRHGYAEADRAQVPEEIRATRQFAAICPASARLLAKPLAVLTL